MWILFFIALAVLGGIWGYLALILPIATGYAAKTMASCLYTNQRNFQRSLQEELQYFRWLHIEADEQQQTVKASLWGFLFPRTAFYREGLGCTLAGKWPVETIKKKVELRQLAQLKEAEPLRVHVWEAAEKSFYNQIKLAAAMQQAFAEDTPGLRKNTRAVVVIHRGKLLAEQYAPGFGPDSRLAGWSLTKTVTNALVGILVKEGKLDLHVPAPIPTWKNQEAFISLDHILRMNTGLDLPENYKGYTRVLRMLFLEPNVAEFAAKAPQKVPPGTFFDYSSPTTNLLATLMRQCFPTLEAYLAFPYTALFHPLGMGSALMETDSAGNYIHSSFMHATARDWARIGQLFLQKGQWQGRQILPENWVDYSLTPTDGASAGQYGAHIWRNAWQEVPGEKRFFPQVPSDMFYASGFEEQKIGVIPSQSLVVVRLGLTYPPRTWNFGDFLQPFVEAVSPQT